MAWIDWVFLSINWVEVLFIGLLVFVVNLIVEEFWLGILLRIMVDKLLFWLANFCNIRLLKLCVILSILFLLFSIGFICIVVVGFVGILEFLMFKIILYFWLLDEFVEIRFIKL